VAGYLGRFVPEKGLDLLMEVLDRIQSPWRALFVGAGPMEQRLREWGSRYGGRVKVLASVPHSEAPDYLNAMDVLCAPSQTTVRWREQFGRMLIEAFACGVPVLTSDSGEIPYVVQDAAMVVAEKDVEKWTEELGRLLENPSLRSKLSTAGLERARAEYSWPHLASRHLEFFDELIERGRG
jgi:glycosyltransferase involved in cell wall biosynthesis